jgi:hypothetical protein
VTESWRSRAAGVRTVEVMLRALAWMLLVVSVVGLLVSGGASSMLAMFGVWLLFLATGGVAAASIRNPRADFAGVWSVASLAVAVVLLGVGTAFGSRPLHPTTPLGATFVAIPALHVVQLAVVALGPWMERRRRRRAGLPRARVVR